MNIGPQGISACRYLRSILVPSLHVLSSTSTVASPLGSPSSELSGYSRVVVLVSPSSLTRNYVTRRTSSYNRMAGSWLANKHCTHCGRRFRTIFTLQLIHHRNEHPECTFVPTHCITFNAPTYFCGPSTASHGSSANNGNGSSANSTAGFTERIRKPKARSLPETGSQR